MEEGQLKMDTNFSLKLGEVEVNPDAGFVLREVMRRMDQNNYQLTGIKLEREVNYSLVPIGE